MSIEELKEQVQIALVDLPEFILIHKCSFSYTSYKVNPVYTVDCMLFYKEQIQAYDEKVIQDELEDVYNKIVLCASEIGLEVKEVISKCTESKLWLLIKIKFKKI